MYRGFGHFATGEWDDAVTELEAGVALAVETGQRTNSTLGFSILALIALHRGDLRRAGAAIDQAIAEVEASGPRFRSQWGAWARALLLDARGEPQEAFTTMAACWDECLHAGLEIELPVLGPDLVRMALAAGDRDRAAQVTDEVARLAKAEDVASHRGAARRCRGLLDGDPEPLLAAVDDYTRASRPPMVALAAEDAATALARTGDVGGARPFLDRALVTFEGIGAARDVARVEARMRALGCPARCPGPPGPPAHRLGEPHPDRAHGGGSGRRGVVEPPGCRAHVPVPSDRPDPPRPRLREARHHLASRARRRGRPPRGLSGALSRPLDVGRLADVSRGVRAQAGRHGGEPAVQGRWAGQEVEKMSAGSAGTPSGIAGPTFGTAAGGSPLALRCRSRASSPYSSWR